MQFNPCRSATASQRSYPRTKARMAEHKNGVNGVVGDDCAVQKFSIDTLPWITLP
jgi:hypothetical protein